MTANSENLIAEAITEWFGERCPEYVEGCWCCKAWKQYDALQEAVRHAGRLQVECDGLYDEIERLRKK